ncbi:MAG: class I SAM-dependent methyltransferase [Miltoncostaeaceae bacterium]
MSIDLTGTVDGHPERFVPEAMSGQLVEAEHMGRYWWVRELASGRRVLDAGCGVAYGSQLLFDSGAHSVTGVDIAGDIVEAARSRVSPGIALEQADLRALPFADGGFDLIVCFEVIEHVPDPGPVVDELARCLAPGGVLAISTPNPGAMLAYNPHHHHELTEAELLAALDPHFAHVRMMRQQHWLAVSIFGDEDHAAAGGHRIEAELRKVTPSSPGEEVLTLALAGRVPPPVPRPVTVLSSVVDIKGLFDHIQHQEEQLAEARRAAKGGGDGELAERVARLEAILAGAGATVGESDGRVAALEAELAQAREVVASVTGSRTWRYAAPLRKAAGRIRGR